MAHHLLTVDHCHKTGFGIQLAPMVRYGRLIADWECGYCKVLAVREGRASVISRPPQASRAALAEWFGLRKRKPGR